MYVLDHRFEDPVFWDGSLGRFPGVAHHEFTWSWRTGKRVNSLDPVRDVPLPVWTGDPVKGLKSRRKFYETIEANMASSDSRKTAGYTDTRAPTLDTGHEFWSAKTKLNPAAMVHYYFRNRSSGDVSNETTGLAYASIGANRSATTPDWAKDWAGSNLPRISPPSSLNLPWTNVQYRVNNMFANMVPNRAEADLGVTAIELVRGDIPSIIKNFKKALERQQSIAKSVGSDYLNYQFGWVPLVSDVTNIIKVLATLDHLVYGTGYRRSRKWEEPTVRTVTSVIDIDVGNGYPTDGTGAFSKFRISSDLGVYREDIVSADYRINARISPRLRPTIGSNAFISKAQDVMERLGVWTPSMGWDLLHWSWLVDWVVHLGSAIDNSVAYAHSGAWNIDYSYMTYVMRRLTTLKNLPSSGITLNTAKFPTRDTYWSIGGTPWYTSEFKCRRRISPFGLGVNLSGLSTYQFSILVALGLARKS